MTLMARNLYSPQLMASKPSVETLLKSAMADMHTLMTARLPMSDLCRLGNEIDRQMVGLSTAMDDARMAIIVEVRARKMPAQMYRQHKISRGVRCTYLYWRLGGNTAASHIDVYAHVDKAHHPFIDGISARNQQLTSAHAWLRYTRYVIRDFVTPKAQVSNLPDFTQTLSFPN